MIPHMPYTRRRLASRRSALTVRRTQNEADLHTQLEEILDAVWKAEADWRFNDRLDLALKRRR